MLQQWLMCTGICHILVVARWPVSSRLSSAGALGLLVAWSGLGQFLYPTQSILEWIVVQPLFCSCFGNVYKVRLMDTVAEVHCKVREGKLCGGE